MAQLIRSPTLSVQGEVGLNVIATVTGLELGPVLLLRIVGIIGITAITFIGTRHHRQIKTDWLSAGGNYEPGHSGFSFGESRTRGCSLLALRGLRCIAAATVAIGVIGDKRPSGT